MKAENREHFPMSLSHSPSSAAGSSRLPLARCHMRAVPFRIIPKPFLSFSPFSSCHWPAVQKSSFVLRQEYPDHKSRDGDLRFNIQGALASLDWRSNARHFSTLSRTNRRQAACSSLNSVSMYRPSQPCGHDEVSGGTGIDSVANMQTASLAQCCTMLGHSFSFSSEICEAFRIYHTIARRTLTGLDLGPVLACDKPCDLKWTMAGLLEKAHCVAGRRENRKAGEARHPCLSLLIR